LRLNQYTLSLSEKGPAPAYGQVNLKRKCGLLKNCWLEALEEDGYRDTDPIRPCEYHQRQLDKMRMNKEALSEHISVLARQLPAFEWLPIEQIRPNHVEEVQDMIRLIRWYKRHSDIVAIDAELWPGKGKYAAVPVQFSLVDVRNHSRRLLVRQWNYGLTIEEMLVAFRKAVPNTHHYAESRRERTAARIYGPNNDSPLQGDMRSEIANGLRKLNLDPQKCLVLYWGTVKADPQCFARILHDDSSVIIKKSELPGGFQTLSLSSFLRRTTNMHIFQLYISYRVMFPLGKGKAWHNSEDDALAVAEKFIRTQPEFSRWELAR
jgi:hypothetical protein